VLPLPSDFDGAARGWRDQTSRCARAPSRGKSASSRRFVASPDTRAVSLEHATPVNRRILERRLPPSPRRTDALGPAGIRAAASRPKPPRAAAAGNDTKAQNSVGRALLAGVKDDRSRAVWYLLGMTGMITSEAYDVDGVATWGPCLRPMDYDAYASLAQIVGGTAGRTLSHSQGPGNPGTAGDLGEET
jgi:hypothetical protein